MKKSGTKVVILVGIFFVNTLFQSGCTRNVEKYEGKYIRIDYGQVYDDEIEDQSWIKIDGITYTHYSDFESVFKDKFSIPASKIFHKMGEHEQYEPYNRISIAIALANFVDKVSAENDEKTARVDIPKRFQVLALGILNLHKADSTSFVVEVPSDYPAEITIIE